MTCPLPCNSTKIKLNLCYFSVNTNKLANIFENCLNSSCPSWKLLSEEFSLSIYIIFQMTLMNVVMAFSVCSCAIENLIQEKQRKNEKNVDSMHWLFL